MKTIFAFLALLLLPVTLVNGQELQVTGETKTTTVVVALPVTVTAPSGVAGLKWLVKPDCVYERDGNSIVISEAKNANYTIEASGILIDFENQSFEDVSVKTIVRIRADKSDDDPVDDDDEPIDDEQQDDGDAPVKDFTGWVVILEETADSTPEMTKIKFSAEWDELAEMGVKRRFYDDDQPEAVSYRELVSQNGFSLPVLFLVSKNDSGEYVVKHSQEMPPDMAGIRKVVGR